jgi:hypothetical protein
LPWGQPIKAEPGRTDWQLRIKGFAQAVQVLAQLDY